MKTFTGRPLLYDVGWQLLRVSLLARNNDTGGFQTLEGCEANISRLQEYLRSSSTPQEAFHRTWRILNLLNATLLGFGQRMKGTEQEAFIIYQRDRVQRIYRNLKGTGISFGMVHWDLVEKDLRELWEYDPYWFVLILEDLKRRLKSAERKNLRKLEGLVSTPINLEEVALRRSDLMRFLSLMTLVVLEQEPQEIEITKVLLPPE